MNVLKVPDIQRKCCIYTYVDIGDAEKIKMLFCQIIQKKAAEAQKNILIKSSDDLTNMEYQQVYILMKTSKIYLKKR